MSLRAKDERVLYKPVGAPRTFAVVNGNGRPPQNPPPPPQKPPLPPQTAPLDSELRMQVERMEIQMNVLMDAVVALVDYTRHASGVVKLSLPHVPKSTLSDGTDKHVKKMIKAADELGGLDSKLANVVISRNKNRSAASKNPAP